MSILSFTPARATIPSTSTGRRFAGLGVSHLSSSSLRMAPVLGNKNTSLIVSNWEISTHRNPESYPTVELNAAVRLAEKHIPSVPHWRFCYTIIRKVFVDGAFLIHLLDPDLRDAFLISYACILSLVCITLDTIEDDTSIDKEVKIPILMAFHCHVYDCEWHFTCGTKDFRVLMNKFHHVSTSFLELGSSYQKVIEDVSTTIGTGMAKFLYKEVETIEDYDEYCHYVAGIIGLGFLKLIRPSGIENLPPDKFFHSISVFAQKADIIQDYLEDTNEIPKSLQNPRMFWPRQIWSEYVEKSEDLKLEKNSIKAVHCLNEMITNASIHTDDCLRHISAVQHPTIFQSCAMVQIVTIGTLASCYNNIQVFRGVESMRFDFYGVFHDFTCELKSKIDDDDRNATKTKERVEAILNTLQELRNLKTAGSKQSI